VAETDLNPCAKARNELFHCGESSGGSDMGRITRTQMPCVNRHCEPTGPARLGRPDDRLREAIQGCKNQGRIASAYA
jgi:hypothetical protein